MNVLLMVVLYSAFVNTKCMHEGMKLHEWDINYMQVFFFSKLKLKIQV